MYAIRACVRLFDQFPEMGRGPYPAEWVCYGRGRVVWIDTYLGQFVHNFG
jgi:hypothetical protein